MTDDELDEDELADIERCHQLIASLVDIIESLWGNIDNPEIKEHPNAERLQRLMATIRRATDPSKTN